MALTMYQASVPTFVHGLGVVSSLLDKGAAFAAERGLDPLALAEARLAPDMLTLVGQVQRASDTAKASAARLSGTAAPSYPDEEVTLDQLKERCARTVAFLEGLDEQDFAGSETRDIPMFGNRNPKTFKGADYLMIFALPNFYFHVATAYDILRHKGVPLAKRDFIGA